MRITPLRLAIGLLLGLVTLNAEADLTPYSSAGKNLVYSSVSNITWTTDANLLGTMISDQGFSTLVNSIIAANPVIYDTPNRYDGSFNNYGSHSGQYSLSANDFNNDGRANWFGAQAFVGYLNSINYGGSNVWALPMGGDHPQVGYNQTGSPFGAMFYTELGGTAGSPMPNTTNFTNEKDYAYWFSTEYEPNPDIAWIFNIDGGTQGYGFKNTQYYAWAVTPGQVATVPAPGALWLMGSGLLGVLSLKRRARWAGHCHSADGALIVPAKGSPLVGQGRKMQS